MQIIPEPHKLSCEMSFSILTSLRSREARIWIWHSQLTHLGASRVHDSLPNKSCLVCRQSHLSSCLDKLMADVQRNLEPKNRDKFTQVLTCTMKADLLLGVPKVIIWICRNNARDLLGYICPAQHIKELSIYLRLRGVLFTACPHSRRSEIDHARIAVCGMAIVTSCSI